MNRTTKAPLSSGGHTPGPWAKVYEPGFPWADVYFNHEAGQCTVIGDQCEANANLIAAAPELHDLLVSAVAAIEHMCERHGYDESDHEFLQSARAAIAKAEGGAS